MTPYEAWYGRCLSVHHLRTFGCIGYMKNTKTNLNKLEDRSKPMVLLRYEPGCKIYRMHDSVGGKLHVSRDVMFDEESS